MKFFRRWLRKQSIIAAEEATLEDQKAPSAYGQLTTARPPPMPEVDDGPNLWDGMRIGIKSAVGGKLVTFVTYDRHHDRRNEKTYIIADDADFTQELGKIITLESMRQS